MVTVSVPGIGFTHSTDVTYDQGATIDLPQETRITNSSSAKVSDKAVIVVATDTVSVYGFYYSLSATDGFFVLPTTALGRDYVAVGYDHTAYFSEFVVLAMEDNTVVNIRERIELSLSLNQYEAYQFVSDRLEGKDVTGLSIKADKPVSVMSGHQCANVIAGGCDHLMENIPPVNILGHHYVLASFLGRNSGFGYRIVSTSSTGVTSVSIPDQTMSLSSGEFYQGSTSTSDEIITIMTDKPVIVSQYAKGRIPGDFGDSFMVVIPSTEVYSSRNVTFPTGALIQGNRQHYISITSKCDSIDMFYLDDILLDTQNVSQTSGGDFCVLRTLVGDGFHSITHSSAASFLVLVYGFAFAEGYGYVAGYQVHDANGDTGEYDIISK